MRLNESKIPNSGFSPSHGSLPRENGDINLRDSLENSNGLTSAGSVSPIDTIPFNIEGIQTVIKNSAENSNFGNGVSPDMVFVELRRYREENDHLRAALKEASRVNQQWRKYHDHRRGYEQKLLSSLQDLQQPFSATQDNERSSLELEHLRDLLSKMQKEHNEHIQLLQLQVRAHREDWEAERCEKKVAQLARIQAEEQLQEVQRQLQETMSKVSELEGKLSSCKCFPDLNGEVQSHKVKKYLQHNGQLPILETMTGTSPSFSSTNSICSSSRSSSVSKEMSTGSSPTISRNFQLIPTNGVHVDSSRTSSASPSVRVNSKQTHALNESQKINFPLNETHKLNETHGIQERTLTNDNSYNMPSSEIKLERVASVSLKTHQCASEGGSSNKWSNKHMKAAGESGVFESTQHNYETRGARPKTLCKFDDEDEKQAKHRARHILASALPLSPSSSMPSSPVKAPSSSDNYILPGCTSIPSCLSTVGKGKLPFITNKKGYHEQLPGAQISKASIYKNEDDHNTSTHGLKSNSNRNSLFNRRKIASHESLENLGVLNGNNRLDGKQRSKSQVNVNYSKNSASDDHNYSALKKFLNELKGSSANSIEEEKYSDALEIKTATKMKQNVKSLIVTNNQEDKIKKNYASITVMPRPSSALYSHTQGTSTQSSRSSSPGISLTTFALNAKGQGVPGAIFFALGTESKSPKNQQQPQFQTNTSNTVSVTKTQPIDEVHSSNTSNVKPPLENELNEHIVNSTWVQLTDKERNSVQNSVKNPWRTARAVPSYKLNSVRKNHSDEVTDERVSPAIMYEMKEDKSLYTIHSSESALKMYNDDDYLGRPSNSYQTKYQTCISPIHTYITCSRDTPPLNSQTGSRKASSSSPSRQSSCKCKTESDLRTKASRNISSAILSYECNNKSRTNISNDDKISESTSMTSLNTQNSMAKHPPSESTSKYCVICPSCQKLFPANSPKFATHKQACGGPKYVDM